MARTRKPLATAALLKFRGDTGSGGTQGMVPKPATGDATKFLRGDGTWAAGAGAGGGISDIVDDASPQLGGDLDLNGHVITNMVIGVNLQAYNANTHKAVINFIIDGGGVVITTGIKGDLYVPFDCTITAATIIADQVGSIIVDIWKDSYANYPPVDADSITSATPVQLSSGSKSQNTTLASWTTSITGGDILRFNVDSVATITRATVALNVTKT